jgi:hypothetical protein
MHLKVKKTNEADLSLVIEISVVGFRAVGNLVVALTVLSECVLQKLQPIMKTVMAIEL